MVLVDDVQIKFKFVLEGRIQPQTPSPGNHIASVAALAPLYMAASKLLANADRWGDDAVRSM